MLSKREYRVLLWGMGAEYNSLLNLIRCECIKGNISVQGIVCRKQDIYCERKDGFPVIPPQSIFQLEWDYIIVSSSAYFAEIQMEAVSLGAELSKIINGAVLKIPFFDFADYVSLIEKPVTIISDDCWGGNVYDYLYLQYNSPTVGMWIDKDDFARFVEDIPGFLNSGLDMESDGDIETGVCPVGVLSKNNKHVRIQFIHSASFDDAKKKWNRRKKRVGDNILVKMAINGTSGADIIDKSISAFSNCPYKKIMFYYGSENFDGKFKSPRFSRRNILAINRYSYSDYSRMEYFEDLNPFRLLIDGENYSRYS